MKSVSREVRTMLLWTLFLQFLIVFQTVSANAPQDTIVKVEPYTSMADIGQTFIVNITISNVQNLFGLEVILNWNSSILQMVSADVRLGVESHPDGILHEPIWRNETKEEGKYMLYGASMYRETPSFNGSGAIVSLAFSVTNAGSCKLNLEGELANKPPVGSVSSPIVHTTIDGFFGPIHIIVPPILFTVEENINISGFVNPAQPNVEVTILYRHERETEWRTLSTVETNGQGDYLYMWQPREGGRYELRTTAVIDGSRETSYSVFLTVEALEQTTFPYMVIIIIAAIIIAVVVGIAVYRRRMRR